MTAVSASHDVPALRLKLVVSLANCVFEVRSLGLSFFATLQLQKKFDVDLTRAYSDEDQLPVEGSPKLTQTIINSLHDCDLQQFVLCWKFTSPISAADSWHCCPPISAVCRKRRSCICSIN